MSIDWDAIKADYITGNASYSDLAKKYGVSKISVARTGGKDGWVDAREQYAINLISKIQNSASDITADGITLCRGTALKLLKILDHRLDTEEIDDSKFRLYSGTIKDLRDVLESGAAVEENTINVIMGDADEYSY